MTGVQTCALPISEKAEIRDKIVSVNPAWSFTASHSAMSSFPALSSILLLTPSFPTSCSNSVLDKAGKLDIEEWDAVKLHAGFTETILSRISAFSELAVVAAAHHERLDGGGYPRGLKADQICLETRIITTADIFDAITAERPYRGAIPIDRTLEMMAETVHTAIDSECFEALKLALAKLEETATRTPAVS